MIIQEIFPFIVGGRGLGVMVGGISRFVVLLNCCHILSSIKFQKRFSVAISP